MKRLDSIVFCLSLLLALGMVPVSMVGDEYPYLNGYRGFETTGLTLIFWTFVSVFLLFPAALFFVRQKHLFLIASFITIISVPTYLETTYKYLNAKLDSSVPISKEVLMSNVFTNNGGRFSRYASTCVIKGLYYPTSFHKYECGRSKMPFQASSKNLLGKTILIEVKNGYFGHPWVFSAKEVQ